MGDVNEMIADAAILAALLELDISTIKEGYRTSPLLTHSCQVLYVLFPRRICETFLLLCKVMWLYHPVSFDKCSLMSLLATDVHAA